MTQQTKISTAQLISLITVSSVTLMITCNASLLGGDSLTDNLLSCGLAFLCNLILVIPVFCLMGRRPDSDLLLQSEQAGRWLLCCTAGFYIGYFLLVDVQYLATFQFFLGNVFHPSIPTWIFPVMIVLAAVYSAFKGLEAMGRTAVLLLVFVLLGIGVIGVLLLPEIQTEHFMPLFYDGPRQTLLGTAFYLSGSASIPIYAILFPRAKGHRKLGFFLWNGITYGVAAFLLVLIIGTLGSFSNLQLFPLYSAATMATLGTFQRMDSLFICIWLIGLFLKLAIDLYCITLCVDQITHRKTAVITKPVSGILICAGGIVIAGSRTLLNVFLDPLLTAPLTVAAAALFPLAALVIGWIKRKRRNRHASQTGPAA